MATKTEELRDKIVKLLHIKWTPKSIELAEANQVLQIFNQWLEEQGANHKVKCPHCSWSQFYAGEMVGMSPCNECLSTGYTFEPLRLEAE